MECLIISLKVRVITKTAPKPSFFHYFSDPRGNDEDEEDEEEEEEGEDKKNEFQLTIDEDYECAHTFRTEIIPDAVLWFTGEAGMDGDYDGEDDEEDGDDAEGEDDDSEGSANPASAGAPLAGAAPPAPGADPNAPECKQS